MRRACFEGHREPRVRARGRDPGVLARQGFPAPSRDGGGRVMVGNPHRATSSSRRIPSRRAAAVVYGTHDASRDTSVAPSGPKRVARGSEGPGGDHAGTRPSRRVGEPETRGTATTRRHAVRGRGMRKVNSVGWHSPCLLRSTLRASATRRQVKRGGVRCWRCSCISSQRKSILRFSSGFSHCGSVRDPPIKQLNTDSLLLH